MVETIRRTARFIRDRRRLILIGLLSLGLAVFLVLLPRPTLVSIVQSLLAQRFLVLLLVLLGLTILSLIFAAGQQVDAWAFVFFNQRGRRHRWMDWVMVGLTQLGSGWPAIGIAVLLHLIGYTRFAIQLILGTLTLWILVETIKAIVDRTRPFNKLENVRIVGWKARGRSFPSGHTSQVFFVASLFVHQFGIGFWPAILFYAVAFLVALTRMYIGVHYPRDVIAGAILGEVWGLLASLIRPI